MAIRVAHLLSSYEVGGAENVVLALCRVVSKQDFSLCTVSLTGDGPMAQRFAEADIETHILHRSKKTPGLDIRLVWHLARVLRREQVDILHCHNTFPKLYGALAALASGTRAVVVTQHAVDYDGRNQKWDLTSFVNPLVSQFLTVSEHVLSVSCETRRVVRERSSVLYNGIDTSRFAPRKQKTSKLPVKIGCVGRLSKEKRHDILLEALSQIQTSRRPGLVLVGDGPTRQSLENQIQDSDLAKDVRLLGTCHNVPSILKDFDIFVLASDTEGLPVALLEAMATGLPVIATRVGGVPELVEDGVNGFLVPPGDPGELASAIEKLVCDAELRQRMGAAGRQKAVRQFSIQTAARKHEELYRALLDNHGFGR